MTSLPFPFYFSLAYIVSCFLFLSLWCNSTTRSFFSPYVILLSFVSRIPSSSLSFTAILSVLSEGSSPDLLPTPNLCSLPAISVSHSFYTLVYLRCKSLPAHLTALPIFSSSLSVFPITLHHFLLLPCHPRALTVSPSHLTPTLSVSPHTSAFWGAAWTWLLVGGKGGADCRLSRIMSLTVFLCVVDVSWWMWTR